MTNTIEVIMIGSPVMIANGTVEATLLAVCLYDKNRITYQCSWWNGRSRISEWLEQHEVSRVEETAGARIGFK